jgi:casein kinase 1
MTSHQPSASSQHHSSSSSNVVGVHYKVGKKLGEGSFGVLYEGMAASNLFFLRCIID